MKTFIIRIGILLMWISITIVAAVLYGFINDQITVTISPEYYSVFKRDQCELVLEKMGLLNAPTRVQAIITGTLGTWWYGLFLGIMLGISSMVGRYSPLPTRLYIRAVEGVMLITFSFSIILGGIAYLLQPMVRPDAAFLIGVRDARAAYAVGWWHNGAYLGALAGTILASFWAQTKRRLAAVRVIPCEDS